ncbi:hypothetical protein VKT23_012004 [Stygiomarasmius scandens]|uniref:Uncharacterized protein n=1 Tax=Marasmiellus scandens TaxID=2682957 RepID=A0ABR1J820_9AGAR
MQLRELMYGSARSYGVPYESTLTFHIHPRQLRTYKEMDELTFDNGDFFVPKSPNNPLFDFLVFEDQGDRVVVWVMQVTVGIQQNTGSNEGYAILEQIQREAQSRIGSGEVVFRYVLVLPHGEGQISWQFPDDVKTETGEVLHKFIPGEVFIQYLLTDFLVPDLLRLHLSTIHDSA